MAPDFQDLAIERDGSLVQGMCQTARNNRRDLHEWIEEELKAVLIAAEIQESLAEGCDQRQNRESRGGSTGESKEQSCQKPSENTRM